MGYLADTYNPEVMSPTATDAYHFTTPAGYYNEGRADNEASFIMFGRKPANGGSYTIAAGLEGVIDIIERWQESGLTDSDIAFLKTQKDSQGERKFSDDFLEHLKGRKFKFKVDAAPEGSLVFPQEPILRAQGSLVEVKMLESVALGIINGASADASKTSRISEAATVELDNGAPAMLVSTQGLRRGPAFGSSIENSRAAAIGGSLATSTGNAAKMLGEAFAGTMDHQWVMAHITGGNNEIGDIPLKELFAMEQQVKDLRADGNGAEADEIDTKLKEALSHDAFRSFAFAHRNDGIFLLDTIDPLEGLEAAITVIKELQELGKGKRYGVRFDSGDLTHYSQVALRRFAEEGMVEGVDPAKVGEMSDADLLPHAKDSKVLLAVADGLNEHSILKMRQNGAAYHLAGVGTGISHPGPLGLVYKMAAMVVDNKRDEVVSYHELENGKVVNKATGEAPDFAPTMKISAHAPAKSSNPGIVNSQRIYDENGKLKAVLVYDELQGLDEQHRAVNLRNFDEQIELDGATRKDLLVPVFNREGEKVFDAPPTKESFPGSGKQTTDLGAISKYREEQLSTLTPEMRAIVKPRDQQISELLASQYHSAGGEAYSVDPKAIEAQLIPEAQQVPVYLDYNLYKKRLEVQSRHTSTATNRVNDLVERFDTVQQRTETPGNTTSGDLQADGGQQKRKQL